MASFTACSNPPQQGTSIRTRVMLRIGCSCKISVSFSAQSADPIGHPISVILFPHQPIVEVPRRRRHSPRRLTDGHYPGMVHCWYQSQLTRPLPELRRAGSLGRRYRRFRLGSNHPGFWVPGQPQGKSFLVKAAILSFTAVSSKGRASLSYGDGSGGTLRQAVAQSVTVGFGNQSCLTVYDPPAPRGRRQHKVRNRCTSLHLW